VHGAGVGLVDLHLGHADGPLEGLRGGEVRERRRRERNLEGLRVWKGGVIVVGVQLRVLNLALGKVPEGGAGVLEAGGVGGVCGGEGVAGGDGVLHEALALLASRHRFLVLDLGLVATHFSILRFLLSFLFGSYLLQRDLDSELGFEREIGTFLVERETEFCRGMKRNKDALK